MIKRGTFHFGIPKPLSLFLHLTLIKRRQPIWYFALELDIFIRQVKIWRSEYGKFLEHGLKLKHLFLLIRFSKMKMILTSMISSKKIQVRSNFKRKSKKIKSIMSCNLNMLDLFSTDLVRKEHQFLQKCEITERKCDSNQ